MKSTAKIFIFSLAACVICAPTALAWFADKKPVKTDALPAFQLPLAMEEEGTFSSERLKGKVVLVNFWATWCGPCVEEFPDLARLHDDLQPKGFTLLAIAMDKRSADVRTFIDKLQPPFPVILGTRRLSRQFGAGSGLPVSFLINRQGKITKKYYGPRSYKEFRKDIDQLLAEGDSPEST